MSWTASGITRGRGAQIARNALSGIGARLAMTAVGFVLTPYIVRHLGLKLFGLWSLTGSVAGYLGLLDFGLAGVFVKFVTEYVESERRDLARQVVTFGALFYAAFGIAIAAPVVLLAPLAVRSLGLSSADTQTAINAFEALSLLLVLTLIASLPGTLVTGMQRMEVVSRNGFVAYLASAVATVVLLRAGWGIAAVVTAGYVQLVCAAALQYRSARGLFGPIWHHPLRLDPEVLKRMFSFGGWTQLGQVFNIVALDVGRFVAAATVGLASVTFYELGSRLAYFSRSLPGYFLDAIMPAASAADARDDAQGIERLYVSGTLYAVFATCGIAGFLASAGDLIVRVWMGTAYPAVSVVLVGLCTAAALASVTGVGMTLLRATGLPKYETYCAAVTAAVTLALTLLLAPRFGLAGVVAGTAAGTLAGALTFGVIFGRVRRQQLTGAPSARLGRPLATLALCCLTASGAVWYVVHLPVLAQLTAGRVAGFFVLLALGLAYGALYATLSIALGAWRDDPSNLLARLRRRGRLVGLRFAR